MAGCTLFRPAKPGVEIVPMGIYQQNIHSIDSYTLKNRDYL